MKTEDKLQRQAAYYVTRLYSGELTDVEEREIRNWCNDDSSHEKEFSTMLQLWQQSSELYTPVKRSYNISNWLAIAAAVLLIISPLCFLPKNSQHEPFRPALSQSKPAVSVSANDAFVMTSNDRQTFKLKQGSVISRVGEVRRVNLTDGSVITLNTNSEITINLTATERFVELKRGEAFFDIHADPNRPFIIDTGNQKIRVLGTQFTVHKEAKEKTVKVSVVKGKVSLAPEQSEAYETTNLLRSGDIATYTLNNNEISLKRLNKKVEQPSWMKGMVRFDDAPLTQIVKELNRYRLKKIQIDLNHSGDLRVSGVFHLENGDKILEALAMTLPIEINQKENIVQITRK
ncbi:FecR family protein [Idiomarina sp. HP20-50]|uniref:FecR family protein n=1 Tax=Idiomarina sp. HP20-50 TaxID=3070813 RepID=UPI00294B0BB8|nr:FecR domain-containing protein [Idiomarina sp. HP20-50]MDV6314994.1 FecR domain-containing protein [Idiomarina sp. HP20-50]